MSVRALPAPPDDVVVLDEQRVEEVLSASRTSDRKRMIYRFHKHDDELVHRMFNALQPSTYVRPHRHANPPKCEVFLVLRGALDFVLFDDGGAITLAKRLRAGGPEFGIDLMPGIFHSFLTREPDTLLYEVKQGPYSPSDDKDFASWAPPEGDSRVDAYVADLERALRERGLR